MSKKFVDGARAALVAAALFACAVPLLKERGEPFTRLVITNASALPLRAVAYRDEFDCTGVKPAHFDGRVAVLDMPVQPWETVSFSYATADHGTVSTCTGIASFRADEQHEYHVDIGETAGACAMRVTRRTFGSSEPLTEVDLRSRTLLVDGRALSDEHRSRTAPARTRTRLQAATDGAAPTRARNDAPACVADTRFGSPAAAPIPATPSARPTMPSTTATPATPTTPSSIRTS